MCIICCKKKDSMTRRRSCPKWSRCPSNPLRIRTQSSDPSRARTCSDVASPAVAPCSCSRAERQQLRRLSIDATRLAMRRSSRASCRRFSSSAKSPALVARRQARPHRRLRPAVVRARWPRQRRPCWPVLNNNSIRI